MIPLQIKSHIIPPIIPKKSHNINPMGIKKPPSVLPKIKDKKVLPMIPIPYRIIAYIMGSSYPPFLSILLKKEVGKNRLSFIVAKRAGKKPSVFLSSQGMPSAYGASISSIGLLSSSRRLKYFEKTSPHISHTSFSSCSKPHLGHFILTSYILYFPYLVKYLYKKQKAGILIKMLKGWLYKCKKEEV
jgi:hypothetical protein